MRGYQYVWSNNMLDCPQCTKQIYNYSEELGDFWCSLLKAIMEEDEGLLVLFFEPHCPAYDLVEILEKKGFLVSHETNEKDLLVISISRRDGIACIDSTHDKFNSAESYLNGI